VAVIAAWFAIWYLPWGRIFPFCQQNW
jgi:hypothetical protein